MGQACTMFMRFALAAALIVSLGAAAPVPRRPAPLVVLPDVVRIALTTEIGTIVVDLDHKNAPLTVENFVRYVDQKRLDGTVFYRTMRLAWGTQPNGLVQAGPRGDPRRVLKPVAHEPTNMTGIPHKVGTLSMARFAPGTATGDFSILLSDMPGLDADPTRDGDKDGYAAFGHVVEGMDVVRRIYDAPISPTMGDGFFKGQMIAKPVQIVSARRVKLAAVAADRPAAISAPAEK